MSLLTSLERLFWRFPQGERSSQRSAAWRHPERDGRPRASRWSNRSRGKTSCPRNGRTHRGPFPPHPMGTRCGLTPARGPPSHDRQRSPGGRSNQPRARAARKLGMCPEPRPIPVRNAASQRNGTSASGSSSALTRTHPTPTEASRFATTNRLSPIQIPNPTRMSKASLATRSKSCAAPGASRQTGRRTVQQLAGFDLSSSTRATGTSAASRSPRLKGRRLQVPANHPQRKRGASCLVEHDSSFAFVPPSETNGNPPCETYLCATGVPAQRLGKLKRLRRRRRPVGALFLDNAGDNHLTPVIARQRANIPRDIPALRPIRSARPPAQRIRALRGPAFCPVVRRERAERLLGRLCAHGLEKRGRFGLLVDLRPHDCSLVGDTRHDQGHLKQRCARTVFCTQTVRRKRRCGEGFAPASHRR